LAAPFCCSSAVREYVSEGFQEAHARLALRSVKLIDSHSEPRHRLERIP
jgi:hypothetical protein